MLLILATGTSAVTLDLIFRNLNPKLHNLLRIPKSNFIGFPFSTQLNTWFNFRLNV